MGRFTLTVLCLLSLSACALGYQYARATAEDRTPLDEYVAKDDPTFSWTELTDLRDDGILSSLYFLNMTSQTWLDEEFSTQSVWWHYMVVAVPLFLEYTDTAVLFIGGGDNDNLNPPTVEEDLLSDVVRLYAESTGCVAVYLKHVPNQPIYFEEDPEYERRTEDTMIAYTWKRFIDDPSFSTDAIARMPMTKAVVRAMDATMEFTQEILPLATIDKFVLAGASKRGWTTWTASAVDTRVIAQAPMVLTCLNFVPNLHKHFRSLGGWSFALNSYYREGLTADLDNPRTQALMDMVDPYAYMHRYTMPTMVVAATGDQFFLPDDTWTFYDDLPGTKLLLMSPNSDHSLVPWVDVFFSFVSFFINVAENNQFPVTSTQRIFTETGGRVEFRTSVQPVSVTVYYSNTPDPSRRDFRANVGPDAVESGVEWLEDDAQDLGGGLFVAEYDNPPTGWLGFLIEAVYDAPYDNELVLTSEVQIIPNTYPFPDCEGAACYGTIV